MCPPEMALAAAVQTSQLPAACIPTPLLPRSLPHPHPPPSQVPHAPPPPFLPKSLHRSWSTPRLFSWSQMLFLYLSPLTPHLL